MVVRGGLDALGPRITRRRALALQTTIFIPCASWVVW
jgi:hypothetical protein